jgi:hypothetical protein
VNFLINAEATITFRARIPGYVEVSLDFSRAIENPTQKKEANKDNYYLGNSLFKILSFHRKKFSSTLLFFEEFLISPVKKKIFHKKL